MRAWLALLAFAVGVHAGRQRRDVSFESRRMSALGEISDEIDLDADTSSTVLLLPGRKFPLNFGAGEFTVHGTPLFINESTYHADVDDGAGHGATGLTVWDGSVVLAKYLEATHKSLQGKRVVELGAGTGIVGLTAAMLGADTYLTDLAYCLPNLASIVDRNRPGLKGKATVLELDWTRPSACSIDLRGPDLILGADIVWITELVSPLVNALKWLTEKDPESGEVGAGAGDVRPSRRTQVLIAHQTRSRASDQLLYKTLEDQGFKVEPIPRRAHHRDYEDQAIDILQIERR